MNFNEWMFTLIIFDVEKISLYSVLCYPVTVLNNLKTVLLLSRSNTQISSNWLNQHSTLTYCKFLEFPGGMGWVWGPSISWITPNYELNTVIKSNALKHCVVLLSCCLSGFSRSGHNLYNLHSDGLSSCDVILILYSHWITAFLFQKVAAFLLSLHSD